MLVASAMSDASASAPAETLVDRVHRLLNAESPVKELTLHRHLLDDLSSGDVLALFQLAVERGSVDLLRKLLRLRLLESDELSSRVARDIVKEGDAAMLDAFLSSRDQFPAPTQTEELLRIAVQQDNAELVASILHHLKVDVNALDDDTGWTALHFAVEWDSLRVQTLLLQAGANINARAGDGMTPINLAVQLGFFDSVRFLVESGADVAITDSTGATPLHTASREGHTALIDYLLHRGAALNARDADGRTPLHAAAFYDESAARFARGESDTQVAVVRALLAHGADVDARDAQGNSALLSAQQGRFDVIVDELLAHSKAPRRGPRPPTAA